MGAPFDAGMIVGIGSTEFGKTEVPACHITTGWDAGGEGWKRHARDGGFGSEPKEAK